MQHFSGTHTRNGSQWVSVQKSRKHKFTTTRNNLSPNAFIIMMADINSDIKGTESGF